MDETHFSICGDVSIHPSAAIAPGVLLQADPPARLIIAAGVSIGAGSILHAHQGTVAIEAGACLGSGVLIVGGATIGANACVGAMTTIWNGCVEAGQVIPSGSLIGDCSRQLSLPSGLESDPFERDRCEPGDKEADSSMGNGSNPMEAIAPVKPAIDAPQHNSPQSEKSEPLEEPKLSESSESAKSSEQSEPSEPSPIVRANQIYGLAAFNELMTSLFPHRQSLDQPLNPESSELRHTPE